MEYGKNILRTEAAYYDLRNASIAGGRLHLNAGGSAVLNVNLQDISRLTEYFKLSLIPLSFTDNYDPAVRVNISITTTDGEYYDDTIFPVFSASGICEVELSYNAGEYDSFVFSVEADEEIIFTLWELCPEASGDLQSIIDGVEQSLPRLLFDYNTKPFVVGTRETTVGIISCMLLDATDIQGHFLLTYTASQAAVLTLRFKDTDSTELFAPVYYDLLAGRGTIGVPHSYLKRPGGAHNFIVTAQVSAGTLTVGTRDMLFTVDGGYLAARTIDIGTTISDFTLEGKDGDPTNIWVIGVDSGELLVRKRVYSTQASNVTFEPMYSLGPALDGAIEFDGDWHLDLSASTVLYNLTTYEVPWCFIIGTDNKLYAQQGDDEDTRVQLDTSVTAVSVVRGYKSYIYPTQDQGIICLYIKNGAAWYRQYVYDNGTFIWASAVEITSVSGTVQSVHVHRLNDYRVGFAITTTTKNYWLISTRTYVGQSFKPEVVSIVPSAVPATVALNPIDSLPSITVAGTLSADRKTITATFSSSIRFIGEDALSWMTIPDALRENIKSISTSNNKLYINLNEAIYVAYTISLIDTALWQYSYNNQWQAMPTGTSFTFDPYNHIATSQNHGTVNVKVSSTSTTVNLRPLRNFAVTNNETVSINVDDFDVDVSLQPLTFLSNSMHDTVEVTVDQITTTVSLLQVGVEPI